MEKIKPGVADAPDKAETPPPAAIAALIARFKTALGARVKDVRVSPRLTDSAVCLVADEGDVDMHLERLLRQHGQVDAAAKRILEINAGHALIGRLAGLAREGGPGAAAIDDAAHLLLDQARILEGVPPTDARAFSRRLARALEKGLGA